MGISEFEKGLEMVSQSLSLDYPLETYSNCVLAHHADLLVKF